MERKQYEVIELWLRERIDYLPDVEITVRAARKMNELGVYLPDVLDVLMSGEVVLADREYDGCHFVVKGRNCDGKEITIFGRFESASMYVAIDSLG